MRTGRRDRRTRAEICSLARHPAKAGGVNGGTRGSGSYRELLPSLVHEVVSLPGVVHGDGSAWGVGRPTATGSSGARSDADEPENRRVKICEQMVGVYIFNKG